MNILITGTSSGIGKALSEIFLANNHIVFGIDINETSSSNVVSFKADITNKDELDNIKTILFERNITLDMIINVAGIHKMASLVESNYNTIKKLIDINLCGTMLINNTFHSLLNKNGKVIIITSEVAEFDPMPFNGLYSVSKTALESYAQALRQELNLINQKVITFQPGSIETPLSTNSMSDTEKLASNTILYKKQANNFLHIAKKFMGKPIKTEKLAKFIYKNSIKKKPKYTYKIHRNLGLVLLNILPKRLQCFIIKSILNIKQKESL